MIPSYPQSLRLIFGLGLILALLISPGITAAQRDDPPLGGYYYEVKTGDTWSDLSVRTGVSVADLKAANPTAVHPNNWLWYGDRLFIPGPSASSSQLQVTETITPTATIAPSVAPSTAPIAGTPAATVQAGYWYDVKPGDTWYIVSRDTGVSILDLWHANPDLRRPTQWLLMGDRVWISQSGEQQAESVTPTPESLTTPETTPVSTLPPTPPPTAQDVGPAAPATTAPTATATPVDTPTQAPTMPPTPAPTPTRVAPTVAPTKVPAAAAKGTPAAQTATVSCPADFESYPSGIASYLNTAGSSVTGLAPWLTGCHALQENLGGVFPLSIQRTDSKDIVVAMHDPASDPSTPRGTLLVYFASARGYVLAGQADGAGKIEVLRIGDVNGDLKPDVVWTDNSCGAHSCFSTLFVYTWDGASFRDWIEGEPTMANASYTFTNTVPGGSGDELVAHGGVITSADAGPQRAWTETYVSPEGGPFRLYSQVYDKSPCLYYQIVDANKLFDNWAKVGFGPAIGAYEQAIQNTALTTCGTVPDELATLRDFARFRIIVGAVGSGKPAQATTLKAEITTAALTGVTNAFLDSYAASRSIVQACRDTTAYAQDHPESWQYLATWGYANPGFTAEDLCPLAK